MAAEASIQNARHSSPFGSATGRSRLRSSRGQSAAISSSSTSGTGSQRWPTVGLLSEHARSLLRGGRPARLGGSDLTFGDADFAEGRLDAEQGRRGPHVLARADRARARSPKRRPSAPSSGSLAHPMLLEAMSRLRAIWMRGIRVPCRCRTGASSTGSGRLSLSLISSSFSHLANGLQPQLAGTLAQPALVSHRVGVTSVPGRRRSRRRGR